MIFGHALGADRSAGFIYCVLGRVEHRQAWSEIDERAFPEQGCGGSFGEQLNSIQHRYGLIVQARGLRWLAEDCAWAYLRDLYDVVVSKLSCFYLAELVTYPAPRAHRQYDTAYMPTL